MNSFITLSISVLVGLFWACSSPLNARELIVRFEAPVSYRAAGDSESPTYLSDDPALQIILEQSPPTAIDPLFEQAPSLPPTLRHLQIWRFEDSALAEQAQKALQQLPGIVYVESNDALKVFDGPNDPLLSRQWYLKNIHAAEAWQRNTGSPDVIVGVIDTGIDYRHEDLKPALWVNRSEDRNGSGGLDPADLNGIDDDGNGYIDDVIGWDFTDAPGFPDGGDYRDADNDPIDEFGSGHGTPIAGIISASQDNARGISGIAPGLTVMNLRAGTSAGFLEEDDVSEAILYAIHNGCKIVNMSFGDVAFSYLLRDAIEYGVSRGVIFVASSGNSGNGEPNYPAAFAQTISVGATDSTDQLAGFSSYGNSLNLVAPGSNIFSTLIDNAYGNTNGTSFAAPVVSAALGLIWSLQPDATPEQVIGALYAGCRDRGFTGWDTFYGHGLVDLPRSLLGLGGFAEILSPKSDGGLREGAVAIIGTAFGSSIESYSLSYGTGEMPLSLTLITRVNGSQVLQDTLAIWNTLALPDTTYTLELRLRQSRTNDLVARQRVFIDRTPPLARELSTLPVTVDRENGALIRLETDDPTAATMSYRSRGGSQKNGTISSPYFRKTHQFILSTAEVSGEIEWVMELNNAVGLSTVIDKNGSPFNLQLWKPQIDENLLTFQETLPISGYLMQQARDFNADGLPEVVFSELINGEQFGGLVAANPVMSGWSFTRLTQSVAIPRDAGTIRAGEGYRLIAGFGDNSLMLGGNPAGEYPAQLVWQDTSNFWVSRLQNYDDDPDLELFALTYGRWKIFDITPDFTLVEIQTLESATTGNNQFGVPWTLLADFDGDGRLEIVLEDLDGDVYVYEADGDGQFRFTGSQRMDGSGGSSLLQAADIDGDGLPEWISAVRNQPTVLSESNLNTQFWSLSAWKSSAGDRFTPMARLNFLGVTVQTGINNGLGAADIDGDGRDEIFFTPFPRVYLLDWDRDTLAVRWFEDRVNSNTVVLADFDGNGRMDALLNQREGLARWEAAENTVQPKPPSGLSATPLDTATVRLRWQPTVAGKYRIYRQSGTQTNFTLLDSTMETVFMDSMLQKDQVYQYAITALIPDYPIPESGFSRRVRAVPNVPPKVLAVVATPPRQLLVQFSEAMGNTAFETTAYELETVGQPASVIRARYRREALLSFRDPLTPGTYCLNIRDISDAQGTPLPGDTASLRFDIDEPQQPFYLVSAALISKTLIRLRFNLPPDPVDAQNPDRYTLKPDGEIRGATLDSTDRRIVDLLLDPQNRLGSLGVHYEVSVSGLMSAAGAALSPNGSRLAVTGSVSGLADLNVYPNPYRFGKTAQPLRFANVPAGCEIFIFSSGGQLLRRLNDAPLAGGLIWDLLTAAGAPVSSGVYIYRARWERQEITGKILIVR